jgi:3-deoxy-D-manno-octulosonate 8-phosphate phosphatase (KDO 8-P phosphatase)
MDINEKAKKIECIICDVDGTLTDGKVYISEDRKKSRSFNIKDGLGLKLWRLAGFKTGFITGDASDSSHERADMLKVDFVYTDCLDKRDAIDEIIQKSGLSSEQIAFVGDDLIDIPVLKKVGLAVAVQDAVPELNECIHYKTRASGGNGAVREIVELVLKAKGLWDGIVEDFYRDA